MSSTLGRWLGAVALVFGLWASGPAASTAKGQEAAPSASASEKGDAATDAAAGAEAVDVEDTESFLRWMVRASGPIGLVILLMSFYLIALVAWMGFHYRRSVALPERIYRDVVDLLAQRQYGEAYNRLAADGSFLAQVASAGVRKLPQGALAAQRAMEMANDDATMEMEHRTTYLSTIGTLGPMIGLVGTVYGMILSFQVIATAGSSPQASQLAAGISTALFATLEGIALSIPAIWFHALFRNRIARLSLEVETAAESLLELFAPGIRSPHPLAASAGSPPSSPMPVSPSPVVPNSVPQSPFPSPRNPFHLDQG